MPPLCSISRSATVAFAPNAHFLAAGSATGSVDSSDFSTESTLQIYSLDFSKPHQHGELPHMGGTVKASESFERLAWGATGLNPTLYPLGLIAGGLSDGTIGLWNPDRILKAGGKAEDVPSALVAKLEGHTGPVRGLGFNPCSPNLLASGAADGETLVWDLSDATKPKSFKLGGSSSSNQGGMRPEVGSLAWNWRFPKILAVGMSNGMCVVWDLGKEKPRPAVTLRHPSGPRRVSALQWNPADAWHIAVGSDEDASPDVLVWDLRNQKEPAAMLRGHSGGVLDLSWCPHDPGFLLSSAKDNRTIVWDTKGKEELVELPRAGNWNFNATWSPTNPGVFATASFDGKVNLYSLETCSEPEVASSATGGDFAALLSTSSTSGPPKPLKRVPAWLRRPVAGHLGFGGKLATLTNSASSMEPGPNQHSAPTAHIDVKQVITEQGLVVASEQFEAAARGDREALRDFCATKASAVSGPEADTWSFLRILFEADATQELLKHLGFEDMLPAAPAVEAAPDGIGAAADSLARLSTGGGSAAGGDSGFSGGPSAPDMPTGEDISGAAVRSTMSGEDFFSNLGGTEAEELSGLRTFSRTSVPGAGASSDGAAPEPGPAEADIQRALYAGNFATAVDKALEVERYADALSIAALAGAGGTLWVKAQRRYQAAAPRPYMLLARCIMDNDFRALIGARPLTNWKETLAMLATYASPDTWPGLVRALAERLAAHGFGHPATLCWVAAGSVDEAVSAWTYDAKGAAASVDTLQNLMERTVVLGVAAGTAGAAPAAGALVARYAGLLAAQGRLQTALEYLDLAPGEGALDTAVLRDRIYRAAEPTIAASAAAPPFPFVAEEVGPAAQEPAPEAHTGTNGYGGGSYYGVQQTAAPQQTTFGSSSQDAYAPAKPSPPLQPSFAQQSPGGWASQQQQQQQPQTQQRQPQQQQQQPIVASTFGAPSAYGGGGAGFGGGFNGGFGGPAVPPPPPPVATAPKPAAFAPAPSAAMPYRTDGAYGSTSSGFVAQQSQPPPPQQQSMQQAPQPAMFVPQAAPPQQHAPPQVSSAGTYTQQPPEPQQPPPPPKGGGFAHTATAYKAPAPQHPQQHGPPGYGQMQQQGPPPGPPAAAFTPHQPARQQPGPPSQGSAYRPAPHQAPQPGVFVPSASPRGSGPSAFGGPPPPQQQHQQQQYQAPQPPAPPPAPVGPPPGISVASADTSKVAAELQPVVAALKGLFSEVQAAVGANPGKRREMDDSNKKLGGLLWRLNEGDVSPGVADKLKALAVALSARDLQTATQIQVALTTTDWDECQSWLTALKRLLKVRITMP